MKRMIRLIRWLLYAALNNQQDATLRFFFGAQWRMPMVLVVLAAFTAGLVVGVLAMAPRWWKHKTAGRQLASKSARTPVETPSGPTVGIEHGN
jgi:lipopolysaccharide assembly protein A